MILAAIILLTLANGATAIYCLRKYARRETVLQLCFVIVWTMHYVVGNILTILSRDLTYSLSQFEYFELPYLIALVVGQYFLWIYLFLLDASRKKAVEYLPLRRDSYPFLIVVLGASIAFGVLLVYIIGPATYFSQEMSQYRARLGEYTFVGVGAFYYLAGFLLPATILVGAYAIAYRNVRTILIFAAAFMFSLIIFVPFGGRGRVVNIVLVLVLNFIILRGDLRISRLITVRNTLLVLTVFALSYVWGAIRESPTTEVSTELADVIRSLSVDTTRLPFQAFIFERYPATGIYMGAHYAEALLGPFYSIASFHPVGLIPDLSSDWYLETVGADNIQSAISPSYLGEIYLNFGVIGVILSPFLFFLIVRGAMAMGNEQSALSLAAVIYFIQFSLFHGGLYALFDMMLLVLPLLLVTRFFSLWPGVAANRIAQGDARRTA